VLSGFLEPAGAWPTHSLPQAFARRNAPAVGAEVLHVARDERQGRGVCMSAAEEAAAHRESNGRAHRFHTEARGPAAPSPLGSMQDMPT
jgi:hypothetical protein